MSLKLDLDEFLKVVEANSRRFDNLTRDKPRGHAVFPQSERSER